MPAVAVTDHGVMFGALGFYEAAQAHGIKPILGVEAYVAPGSRFDREPGENEEKYHHLTLLARDDVGYRNLLQLVSAAHLEGFYHRPRMDKQLLAEHAEGLTCLSGCLSSELSKLLLAGQDQKARDVAAGYRDIFGAQLLDRAPGPRTARAGPGDPATGGARARARDRPRRHQRPPLHDGGRREAPRRAPLHPAAEAAVRPEAAAVRRRGVLPEVRGADAHALRRAARGLRQHARDRRLGGAGADLRRRGRPGGPVSPAALRGARRPDARGVPAGADPRRRGRPLRRSVALGDPRPPRPGARGDPPDGPGRLLPDRVGPDPVRPRAGHPGRPRARIGRRLRRVVLPPHHRRRPAPVRPDLRAVPQPGADPDAGHRHGLRRAPARRGDQVRERQVRRGPRRPDRHVPDDQGKAGDPRRRARPRLPAGRGGSPLQDVSHARDGPRPSDRGGAEAVAGARGRVRARARGEGDRRHRARARRSAPRGLRARRRRRDR